MRKLILSILFVFLLSADVKSQSIENEFPTDTFDAREFIDGMRGAPCLSFMNDSVEISVYGGNKTDFFLFYWKEDAQKFLNGLIRWHKIKFDYSMYNGYIIHTTAYNIWGKEKYHLCYYIDWNILKIYEVEICLIP